ncbi:MAG: hypothetical protein ACUVUC_15355 [Thermoguttaceae bacterium]
MATRFHQIRTFDELREYVNETFCDRYQLQNHAFRMTERLLRRGSKPCGVYFSLQGPRAVRFSAIWESDRNQVLFYGLSGERFLKTQLLSPLSLDRTAA